MGTQAPATPSAQRAKRARRARQIRDAWDLGLKLFAAIVPALGIIIGVLQYNNQSAEDKRMEFKRNMYARKLAAYEKVGSSVASLLTIPRATDGYLDTNYMTYFDSCEQVFRQLYWGVLPLVEDTSVELMMIRFGDQVHYYRRHEDPYDTMVTRGVALMDTCKRSLERYWAHPSQYEELAEE